MNAWQWFLAHGDKLLATLTAWLASPAGQATIPVSWAPSVAAFLTVIHLLFLPEPATPPTVSAGANKQAGQASLLFLAFLAIAVMAACASLSSLTLDEKLGTAQISVTQVVKSATTAVTAGTLSSDNGQAVLGMAQSASALISQAHAAEAAGNTAGANADLALITTALTGLQTYLNSKVGHPASAPPAAPAGSTTPKTTYYATQPAWPRVALQGA